MDLLFFSPHATPASVKPKHSKLALAPRPASGETPGQRPVRLRPAFSFSQVELADNAGLVQTLALAKRQQVIR